MAARLPESEMPEGALLDLTAAIGAVSCVPAAQRVALLSLQCLRIITAIKDLHTPLQRPLLSALLTSFSDAQPGCLSSPAELPEDQVSQQNYLC